MIKNPLRALPSGSSIVLLAVVLGATLRFTGIGWGLQHPPHADEQDYVESVNAMLDAGDLDHRYYYYPGLFFYLLAPLVGLLGESRRHGPEAYLACRVLIAFVSSLNVWLAAVVARRFAGPWAAAGAAFALAVFPLSTAVAHEIRPDVLLETLGLLALVLYDRFPWQRRELILSGLLLGIATAIKFSGLLFAGGIGFALLARKTPPVKFLIPALVAGAVVLVATPYMLIHAGQFFGHPTEVDVYFHRMTPERWWRNMTTYGQALFSLGGIPMALAVATGLVTLDPARRRAFWPWLAHLTLTFGAFSLASIAFTRHLLQVAGALPVLLGIGVARVAKSSGVAAGVLMLLCLVPPFRVSLDAALAQARPSASDQAREWIEANLKTGSVILETRRDASPTTRPGATMGVDRARFEFLTLDDPVRSDLRLLVPHVDLALVDPDRTGGSLFAGGTRVFEAPGPPGLAVDLVVPGGRAHPTLAQPIEVLASTPAQLSSLADARFSTRWRSERPMNGSEWIEFHLAPTRLCRVEIDLPVLAGDREPYVEVLLREPGAVEFRKVHAVDARPRRDVYLKIGRSSGQALVFEPQRVDAIRLEQRAKSRDHWVVSDVRLLECADAEARPTPGPDARLPPERP